MCVPRADAGAGVRASQARTEREEATRAALAGGQLGLDRYDLRPLLRSQGVEYVTAAEYAREDR
jgi:4-hydroxy-4-methyl-2-oxoglutarate aldolase